jgi:aminoglycoside phosphotransferase (APT) family kinase protein
MSVSAAPLVALSLVPGAGADGQGVLAALRLTGGSVNDCWRVTTRAGEFVLRIQGADWRGPGVDRRREQEAQHLAAQAGLAPAVIAQGADGVARVTDFVRGRVWEAPDYDQSAQLLRLCRTLAAVHGLPTPTGDHWRFEPLRLADDYVMRAGRPPGAAGDAHAAADATLQALAGARAAAATAASALAACAVPPVLTHGDALAGNVVDDGRLWLIDWEFAQCADPVWDLAAFAIWTPRPVADWCALALAAGWSSLRLAERLDAALALHRALAVLWYLARGECVPPVLVSGTGSRHTSAPCVADTV